MSLSPSMSMSVLLKCRACTAVPSRARYSLAQAAVNVTAIQHYSCFISYSLGRCLGGDASSASSHPLP